LAGDLHIHTTASDGTFSPAEVVAWATRLRLSTIGITDHDSVQGVELAKQTATGTGISVLGGVEINTSIGDCEVHVLGYGMGSGSPLNKLLARIRSARRHRVEEMVAKLQAAGFRVELNRVIQLAAGGTLGRPHVARALMEQGYVRSIAEAFRTLLGYGCLAYVPRYKVTPHQAVEEILAARGVPVLAHPGVLRGRGANIANLLPSLVERGLMGLEVYHSEHTGEDVRRLLNACKRYGLLITGGSDCHGSSPAQPALLGRVRVPDRAITALREACLGEEKFGNVHRPAVDGHNIL
jgi:predicted metal-dependent phosphoesterase TrpH